MSARDVIAKHELAVSVACNECDENAEETICIGLRNADAILSALAAAGCEIIQWQPIESAPKDVDRFGLTRRLLLGFNYQVNAAKLEPLEGYWRVCEGYKEGWVSCMDPNIPKPIHEPTHWAPLPRGPREVKS